MLSSICEIKIFETILGEGHSKRALKQNFLKIISQHTEQEWGITKLFKRDLTKTEFLLTLIFSQECTKFSLVRFLACFMSFQFCNINFIAFSFPFFCIQKIGNTNIAYRLLEEGSIDLAPTAYHQLFHFDGVIHCTISSEVQVTDWLILLSATGRKFFRQNESRSQCYN